MGVHFIKAGSSIFGKSKLINSIIKDQKLQKEFLYYVGDEIRDLQAAKTSKIKSIAVSWGYNSKEVLTREGADYFLETPTDLLSIFKI